MVVSYALTVISFEKVGHLKNVYLAYAQKLNNDLLFNLVRQPLFYKRSVSGSQYL
jgi:hypothetical protein